MEGEVSLGAVSAATKAARPPTLARAGFAPEGNSSAVMLVYEVGMFCCSIARMAAGVINIDEDERLEAEEVAFVLAAPEVRAELDVDVEGTLSTSSIIFKFIFKFFVLVLLQCAEEEECE